MTPTTNLSLKKIDGSENWREIFDDHNDSMDLIDAAVKSNSDEISTIEKSLIYVVDGNKCANAVPVGSYVQLINSTISGRSDGCYTVKTAIPANTAIDNTYFNETAPIAGGAINSLNSNLASIGKMCKLKNSSSGTSYSFTIPTDVYSGATRQFAFLTYAIDEISYVVIGLVLMDTGTQITSYAIHSTGNARTLTITRNANVINISASDTVWGGITILYIG